MYELQIDRFVCYAMLRWVYITYGIGFKAKQNLDIKKQPV